MINNPLRTLNQKTLYTRLLKSVSILTLSLFFLFTLTTLFIAYALEDAIFKEQLRNASIHLEQNQVLPPNIKKIEDLADLKPSLVEQLVYLELGDSDITGEFKADGKHFHYLVTEQGTLVLDTTDTRYVNRALNDIFTVLFVILVPALVLGLLVAKVTAKHAIKPFHQLNALFSNSQKTEKVDSALLATIQEQDVKRIAEELWHALEQRSQLLERQVAFNQGMAHELRTPLQVMTHSTELLSHSFEALNNNRAFTRLNKSVERMHRLSNGLLWLTSEQDFNSSNNVLQLLDMALQKFSDITNTHNINVSINTDSQFEIKMPEEVLELIVFNLLNNIIHHGRLSSTTVPWHITITKQTVTFTNDISETSSAEDNTERFGVGLTLVSNLSKRFGYATEILTEGNQFSLCIKTTS